MIATVNSTDRPIRLFLLYHLLKRCTILAQLDGSQPWHMQAAGHGKGNGDFSITMSQHRRSGKSREESDGPL